MTLRRRNDREWEHPEILVELSGADSPLVLENGAELLRAFEHVSLEMLRLAPDEHEKISFDCQHFRSARLQELRLAADVAAERVRKSGMPYAFAPMSSRERRIVHLALRDFTDLRTESDGEAASRHVVVYPKDYKRQTTCAAGLETPLTANSPQRHGDAKEGCDVSVAGFYRWPLVLRGEILTLCLCGE